MEAFIRALPEGLRAPITAANQKSLDEFIDNVTPMYAILNPEDVGLAS